MNDTIFLVAAILLILVAVFPPIWRRPFHVYENDVEYVVARDTGEAKGAAHAFWGVRPGDLDEDDGEWSQLPDGRLMTVLWDEAAGLASDGDAPAVTLTCGEWARKVCRPTWFCSTEY